jgi:hypothetical protein
MKQIRNNVFETNSSSTHSICISKKPVTIGKNIYFGIGEFGWENDCVNTADYLYTAILVQDECDELLGKLKKILDKYSIEYNFERPRYHTCDDGYKWLEYGYIDHSDELQEFLSIILSDEDMLMRYLFGDSCVYTGNDNQDDNPSGCNIAEDTYYDWDKRVMVANPYHDTENYDYFYKTN